MRKLILISFFLLSTICAAQENNSISQSEKEWIELLNHTPKNFKVDLKNKPSSKFLRSDLNSIWKLKTAYELKDKLSIQEIEWLDDQINQLAVAFFLEKRPVVMENVSYNPNSSEQLITIESKNEIDVTILSFVYGGCIVSKNTEDFIQIFNSRTDKLLLNLKYDVDK